MAGLLRISDRDGYLCPAVRGTDHGRSDTHRSRISPSADFHHDGMWRLEHNERGVGEHHDRSTGSKSAWHLLLRNSSLQNRLCTIAIMPFTWRRRRIMKSRVETIGVQTLWTAVRSDCLVWRSWTITPEAEEIPLATSRIGDRHHSPRRNQ